MTGMPQAPEGTNLLTAYPDRGAWLRARHEGVGASESAALFGLSPYHDRFSLWAKKIGEPPQDDDKDEDDEVLEVEDPAAERMEWGHLLEGPIAAKFEQRTASKLWHFSDYCIARHARIPQMLATVDRFVLEYPARPGEEGTLEIKNSSNFGIWADGPPPVYQCQAQHQLAVTGRQFCVLAVLLGGNRLRFWEVEPNPTFIAELEAQVVEFWEDVKARRAPELTGHKACLEAVKLLHPSDNGAEVTLPEEAATWWAELQSSKAVIKGEKERERLAETRLREAIGDATFGLIPGGLRLSLKTTQRAGYEVEPCSYRTLRAEKTAGEKNKRAFHAGKAAGRKAG